jgi:hypothetical protein
MEIFGFAIAGLLALILAIVGVLMLTKINLFGLGPTVRSVGGKRFAVIIGIVLLVVSIGGAITYVKNLNVGNLLQTGSLTTKELEAGTAGITGLSCVFATPTNVAPEVAVPGIKFRADPDDLSHYYADVQHVNGTASINGTLSCRRTGDVNLAGVAQCYAKADSFRSETSTSDANVYYIVATTASASKVAGMPWRQTIYLNDGAVATTASEAEETDLVFVGGSGAESQEDLGYYLTLPGATAWSYLNNQTSNDVHIYCNFGAGDEQVARLTITKVTSTA